MFMFATDIFRWIKITNRFKREREILSLPLRSRVLIDKSSHLNYGHF